MQRYVTLSLHLLTQHPVSLFPFPLLLLNAISSKYPEERLQHLLILTSSDLPCPLHMLDGKIPIAQ